MDHSWPPARSSTLEDAVKLVPVVCMSAWILAAIIAKGNSRKAKIRRNTQREQGWYPLALAHPCPILTAPWTVSLYGDSRRQMPI
jgi:hypothetical protein